MPQASHHLARWSVRSARLFDRTVNALRSMHNGFWLGVLGDRGIDLATDAFYSTAADTFLSPDHNLDGLWAWEEMLIARHFTPGARVLVPAAGAGREIIALDSMGYTVVGYDPTSSLVEYGNELISDVGSEATLITSEGNDLPRQLKTPFDCVLFGWTGISHIRGRAQRIAVFQSLFDVLEPGGVLVASFQRRETESPSHSLTYWAASLIHRVRRSRDSVELGDTLDGSFDHCFTVEEINAETSEAGFVSVEATPIPTAVIVCRKPVA